MARTSVGDRTERSEVSVDVDAAKSMSRVGLRVLKAARRTSAFENQIAGMLRGRESIKKAFEGIEL